MRTFRCRWIEQDPFELTSEWPLGESETIADADSAPTLLMLQPGASPDHTVYAPPAPPTEAEGANTGGINLDLSVRYLTDYLYRGMDRTRFIGAATGDGDSRKRPTSSSKASSPSTSASSPTRSSASSPTCSMRTPCQTFQEIRPVFGAELYLRPFIFAGGNNTYLFPDRDPSSTQPRSGPASRSMTRPSSAATSRSFALRLRGI